jgi:hypothetical protein
MSSKAHHIDITLRVITLLLCFPRQLRACINSENLDFTTS